MNHVVVGVIKRIENNKEKYLLISSKRNFDKYTGYYYPPGGHIEGNEDYVLALKREIEEEVGLKIISQKKIAETPGDVADQITHWYICEVDSYNIKKDDTELEDAGFFSQEEILKMKIWPATLDFFKKYIF